MGDSEQLVALPLSICHRGMKMIMLLTLFLPLRNSQLHGKTGVPNQSSYTMSTSLEMCTKYIIQGNESFWEYQRGLLREGVTLSQRFSAVHLIGMIDI